MSFDQYDTIPLSDSYMTQQAGATCCGYGTGESHRRIIQSAGGEIGYDGFKDPRPNHSGPIYAERVFINQKTNEIQGINFRDSRGEFCCSYVGYDYQQIKDYNRSDCSRKEERYVSHESKTDTKSELDEYGVAINKENKQQTNKGYDGGIKR